MADTPSLFGDRCPTCGRPLADPGEPREGLARHDGPDTMRAAARRVAPRSGTQRERTLRAVLAQEPRGATDDQLEQLTGYSHQTVSARRNELVRDGYLEADRTGLRRQTRQGSPAIVWQPTALALEWRRATLAAILQDPPA